MPSTEYVESRIYLNSDVSPITGYMQLKFTPHLRQMLEDFDKHHIWKYSSMFSSQCGKTTAIFSLIAKALDTDPTNIQLATPTDIGVSDYVTGKFDPFFNGIKTLKNKFNKFKEVENTRNVSSRKRVAGGTLFITGSGAKERRSRTVKYMFCDEVSLFEQGAVTELIGRTKMYEKFFRKVFLVSTKKDELDEITKAYEDSKCKKEWKISCPKCKKYFYATHKHFGFYTEEQYIKQYCKKDAEFNRDDYIRVATSIDAYVECSECNYHISSEEKDNQILKGNCKFDIVAGSDTDTTVGYKANALTMYATHFNTIAELLIKAETFAEKNIIYIDYFNDIYKEEIVNNSDSDILSLGNGYDGWIVPDDTVRIYLTVDTQKDHFYYQITAFQYGFIANRIAHGRIETTHDIKELMFMTLKDNYNREYRINKCMIDRRGLSERTQVVDEFIIEIMNETGEVDFVYASEGVAEITGNQVFRMKRYKKELDFETYEFKVMTISNLLTKNGLNDMIQRTISKINSNENDSASDYNRRLFFINEDVIENELSVESTIHSYSRHLTSEEYIYKIKKGKQANKKTWEKKNSSVRNDYWDCSAMAVALAESDLVGNLQKPTYDEEIDNGDTLIDLF